MSFTYVDSGAMYRAVTLYLLEAGIAPKAGPALHQALGQLKIAFDDQNRVCLNGQVVEAQIREMRVSDMVSEVAALTEVRRMLVAQQRALGLDEHVVMDGRDIGTVVFPDAPLKIFLTASQQVRSERRYKELFSKGLEVRFAEVEENLRKRDRIDTSREDSPLRQAEDAVVIDNTNLSPEEQLAMALALARLRINQQDAQ